MIIGCALCGRSFSRAGEERSFARLARPAWSERVCRWCWDDFVRSSTQLSEDHFAKHVAIEMARLAKRAAEGKSVLRCEAMCSHAFMTCTVRRVDSPFRCRNYASTEVEDRNVCGLHADHHARGRKLEYTPDDKLRFIIVAGSPEEFATAIRASIPAAWLNRVQAEITAARFIEPESAPLSEAAE